MMSWVYPDINKWLNKLINGMGEKNALFRRIPNQWWDNPLQRRGKFENLLQSRRDQQDMTTKYNVVSCWDLGTEKGH